MASDEIDREEVDRLVKEMAARRKAPVVPVTPVTPVAPMTATQQTPAPEPQAPVATPARPQANAWSSNRLLMPSMRKTSARKVFAFASDITMNMPTMPRIGLPAWTEAQWAVLTARMFVALGVALGAAMPYWPYKTAGPWSLGLYVSAIVLLIVTGIWGSKLTWDARLARAHTIAVATVMWGVLLVAILMFRQMGTLG